MEVYAANKPGHLELEGLFTDSSSRIYDTEGLCGPRFFELYDVEGQNQTAVPAGLAHIDNENQRLQLDCSQVTNDGVFTTGLRASLANYPEATPLDVQVNLKVTPNCSIRREEDGKIVEETPNELETWQLVLLIIFWFVLLIIGFVAGWCCKKKRKERKELKK